MADTTNLPSTAVALDQDTVIGDAMIEAAILVYDIAVDIARKIADNAQYAIDLSKLHDAELALAYMQGVDFGLAMDVKDDKAYLAHMEKCIDSIRKSKDAGFQLQVYTPPAPWIFLGFDEQHARAVGNLFMRPLSKTPPTMEDIRKLEDEMWKSKGKDPGKLVPDPRDPSGKTLVMADLKEEEDTVEDEFNGGEQDDVETIEDVVVGDSDIPKKSPRIIKKKANKAEQKMEDDGADFKAKVANAINKIKKDNAAYKFKDLNITTTPDGVVLTFTTNGSTPEERKENGLQIKEEIIRKGLNVTKNCWLMGGCACQIITIQKPKKDALDSLSELRTLKNLYRTKKINKTALKGGLATLLATGMISKADFYGAMNDSEYS